MKGKLIGVVVLAMWITIVLITSVPAPAQHMNEPDAACAGVVITADLVSCLWKARNAADTKLNSVYQHLRTRLDTGEEKQLVETERLWIQYRDANCTAERDLYGNGTGQEPAYLACLEAMTRERTKELQVTYAVRLK